MELAVSGASIGNTTSLYVYADVNNSVYVPSAYANYNYTVAAPTGPLPPVAVGTTTLDGSLTEWTAADRIDASLGLAGY